MSALNAPNGRDGPAAIDDDEAVGFLRDLIVAQRTGESAVQALVGDRLMEAGCRVDVLPYEPTDVPVVGEFAAADAQIAGERANVVARLEGDPDRRSIMLFAHPDSEPIAGTELWNHDPFAGEIDDGRLYGWGVADDLAGIATGVLAIVRAARSGRRLGDVVMASTPSKRHARGVSAALHQGLAADGALYLHPAESGAGLNEIKAFASGQLEFRVTIDGQPPMTTEPGHTAFAHMAVNPIDKALIVRDALVALDRERGERVHHPMLDDAAGRSTNLMVSVFACGEEGAFSRLSGHCVLGGAVSFPPGEAMEDVQAEIIAAIGAAADADPHLRVNRPRVEWIAGVTGAACPPDHPLYRAAARAITETTGLTPHVNPMHTSSDIRNPAVQKGIPTVGLGGLCGDLSQNGNHDEWIDVADYVLTIDAAAAMIIDWCGKPRAEPT